MFMLVSWFGLTLPLLNRSEERRVGKECRSRWKKYHRKKKEDPHPFVDPATWNANANRKLETARKVLADEQSIFFFKQKTAYEIGLGIPAEPLFRSAMMVVIIPSRTV